MSVWAGLQDFRHRMSQAFAASQPYEPSAKELLKARADEWKRRQLQRPAQQAAQVSAKSVQNAFRDVDKRLKSMEAISRQEEEKRKRRIEELLFQE